MRRIKNLEFRVKNFFALLLSFIILNSAFLTPAYADVDLKDVYAFGGIKSVGEAVGLFVYPIFAVAGITVIFYFLIGAFKYIISKGDKNLVDAARNQMTHAIIGFIILAIIFFIMQYLAEIPEIGIPNII